MPALEPLTGIRMVASQTAIDGARWQSEDALALRLAPDELLVLAPEGVRVFEDGAIYDVETGFAGAWLTGEQLDVVRRHTEWSVPVDGHGIAQGKVAGVPVKLRTGDPAVRPTDAPALLVVQTAHADELRRRLGW